MKRFLLHIILFTTWASFCFAQPQYKWQTEAPIANFAWDENDTTRYAGHYLYERAYRLIEDMLTDKRPLDFAEAVFVVEDCLFDGTLDHSWYLSELNRIATGIRNAASSPSVTAGATPMNGRSGEILMTTHDVNGVVTNATENYKQGLYRLEDYLFNGTPCIIGVDYKSKQAHNLAPSGDGMADHFVTIVGMTINVQNGSTSYYFYDPGSTIRGASPNNIISIVGNFLQGRTAAFSQPFKVTTIRKNKF